MIDIYRAFYHKNLVIRSSLVHIQHSQKLTTCWDTKLNYRELAITILFFPRAWYVCLVPRCHNLVRGHMNAAAPVTPLRAFPQSLHLLFMLWWTHNGNRLRQHELIGTVCVKINTGQERSLGWMCLWKEKRKDDLIGVDESWPRTQPIPRKNSSYFLFLLIIINTKIFKCLADDILPPFLYLWNNYKFGKRFLGVFMTFLYTGKDRTGN